MFPKVPPEFSTSTAVRDLERGWRFLQAGDLKTAEQAFHSALKTAPGFYPAETATAYLELARRDYKDAVTIFDRVLGRSAAYSPALIGRGNALLAAGRRDDALQSFEAAIAADPTLVDIRRRVEALRFQQVQENVSVARREADAGRSDQAREAFQRAIAASPDSGFLYRELALVERRTGEVASAFEHARKAVELDPNDARAFALIGELHELKEEWAAAIDAYSKAQALEPTSGLGEKIAALRDRIEFAGMPGEYRAIASSAAVSRAELAALVGVRLSRIVEAAGRREAVLITDARGHWAGPWILAVTRAGIMEVYPNHTFDPNETVRRGDLAQVVSRTLDVLAARDPSVAKQWQDNRPRFADLAAGHLRYPAAARAVAAGILPILEGGTFQLTRPVSGEEALNAIERLEALARETIPRRGVEGRPR